MLEGHLLSINVIVTNISFVGYTWLEWLKWQGGSDVGTVMGGGKQQLYIKSLSK